MNDNTILRIKVPAHLYESVKEQLTLKESKNRLSEAISGTEEELKDFYKKVKEMEVEGTDIDSAIQYALFDINNPDAAKELSTMNEAKKGKHNLGAGMEIVKEKKMKTPKDGMKKMQEVEQVQETEQVEEGLMDMLRSVSDKVAYDIFLDTPKGMSKEDRAKNIQSCITDANNKKKTDPKIDRDDLIVNCLREKGWKFADSGSQPGMSAMGGKWAEGKKDRTMEELKKAKDMLEMKIKKMEESLNEKKHKEEEKEEKQ